MKFFHLADLHIGKRVNNYSMIEDQKYIFDIIFSEIDKYRPDAVLIAGDVYDKVIPSADAVTLFDDFLNRLADRSLTSIIISGNHDSSERLAYAGSIMKKHGIYISPVFDNILEPVVLNDEFGELNVYMLPFIKPVQVKKYFPDSEINSYNDAVGSVIDNIKLDKSKRNIILVHQFVTSSNDEVETSDSEENYVGALGNVNVSLFDDFDYVAMGHLHKAQKVGRETARYSGSILKYSFSEASHIKSITMFEIKSKNSEVTVETIPLKPLRDMIEIIGEYGKIMDKSFYDKLNTDDYYHITLTDEDEIPNVLARLRTVYPNIMRLDYKNSRTSQNQMYDVVKNIENKTPMEIINDFYKTMNNRELDDNQKFFLNDIIEKIWG